MASRRANFRSRHKAQNQSQFFALPPEIRNLIYFHAFVYPGPIDLCPPSYIEHQVPTTDPSLLARLSKYENESVCLRPWIRDQHDLRNVRKTVPITLLSTCARIYHEASPFFWSHNTFRFSDDASWTMLYRFLLSIGPFARSRLTKIQVMAPWAYDTDTDDVWFNGLWGDEPSVDLGLYHLKQGAAKNWPKMRMAKVDSGDKSPGAGKRTHAIADIFEGDAPLGQSGMLNLELLVASRRVVHNIHECAVVPDLLDRKLYNFARAKVVIESGAAVPKDICSKLTSSGFGVRYAKGSFRPETYSEPASDEDVLLKTQTFQPDKEETVFLGLMEMFELPQEICHARGGRATRTAGPKKIERVLRGFGGCRFVWREYAFCCSNGCTNSAIIGKDRPSRYDMICRGLSVRPGQKCTNFEFRHVLDVKNIARYQRIEGTR
ncbi:MAG: hypothetical protein M1820_008467 [Bogoriella megaspora]|nr:MAG: hypothetical protein M1820_008467 [Bogoriella megaspora]